MIEKDYTDEILGGTLEILRRVESGEGGFATVYEALDQSRGGSHVAVKILKQQFKDDEKTLKRFSNEAKMIIDTKISCPNIIMIYSHNQQEQYYTMDLLPESLSKRMRRNRGILPQGQIIRVSLDIANALLAMERRGIVHRDIKPSNIMFDSNGIAYLADFGIAIESGAIPQEAMGTKEYMSPEQFKKTPIDYRSDQYAFGILLFRISTGCLPFEGDSDALRKAHQETPFPSLSDYMPIRNSQLENIILKLVQKEKEQRYQSVSRLIEELKEVRKNYRADVLKRAQRYQSQNKTNNALAELNAYLEDVDPDDELVLQARNLVQFETCLTQADASRENGDIKKAKEHIENAKKFIIRDPELKNKYNTIEESINQADGLHQKYVQQLNDKSFDQALKTLEELHQIAPNNEKYKNTVEEIEALSQAVTTFEKGNYSEAQTAFEAVTTHQLPTLDYIDAYRKRLKKKIAHEDEMLDKYKALIEDYKNYDSIKLLATELSRLSGKDNRYDHKTRQSLKELYSQIQFELSAIYQEEKNLPKALEHLEKVKALQPGKLGLDLKILEIKAMNFENNHQYDLAKEIYSELDRESKDQLYSDKMAQMHIKAVMMKRIYNIEDSLRFKQYDDARQNLNQIEETIQYESQSSGHAFEDITQRVQPYHELIELVESKENEPAEKVLERVNKVLHLAQVSHLDSNSYVVTVTQSIQSQLEQQASGDLKTATHSEVEEEIKQQEIKDEAPQKTEDDKPDTDTTEQEKPSAPRREKNQFNFKKAALWTAAAAGAGFLVWGLVLAAIKIPSAWQAMQQRRSQWVLNIDAIPDGTTIVISDSIDVPIQNGMARVNLSKGLYEVRISNSAYNDTLIPVAKGERETLRLDKLLTVPTIVKPVVVKDGTLRLTVKPAPDYIRVNGRRHSMGRSTMSLQLKPGSAKIEVFKQGYQTLSETIDIQSETTTPKLWKMEALPLGSLTLSVIPPIGSVRIDDNPPLKFSSSQKKRTIDLVPGEHRLIYQHQTIWGQYEETITIESGQEGSKNIRINDLLCEVQIKVKLNNRMIPANLEVNGKTYKMAKPAHKAKMLANKYQFNVVKAGMVNATGVLNKEILPGQSVVLEFQLKQQ